jgi:hypothetical protein
MRLLVWVIFLSAFQAYAQRFESAQLSYHGGWIYVHHPELDSLGGYSTLIQLDGFRALKGDQYWQHLYRFPRVGFTLLAGETGSKHLGRFLSAMAFLEPTLFERGGWRIRSRLAFGLGYMNKPYHADRNPTNQLIGTHLNYALQGTFSLGYRHKSWELGLLAAMTHFSNAAFYAPNKGINIPTYGLYLCRQWKQTPPQAAQPEAFDRKWQLHLNLGGGIKQIGNFPTEPQFGVWSATAYVHKRLSYVSALQFGATVFGDGALKHQLGIIQRNDQRLLDVKDHHTAGLLVGYEARMKRLAILIQVGGYLYDPVKFYAPVFQRYGLKYYLTERLFLGGNLKAHFGAADFAEFNLGYVLKSKG